MASSDAEKEHAVKAGEKREKDCVVDHSGAVNLNSRNKEVHAIYSATAQKTRSSFIPSARHSTLRKAISKVSPCEGSGGADIV